MLTFTTLLTEIKATYPEQPRAFHVLATRYYLGKDNREELEAQASGNRPVHTGHTMRPTLTTKQVVAIIENR